jgi:phage terminase large subunit GpA-like protein
MERRRANAAVKRGTWRASALFTGTAGFHLSGIYSPWVKITEMMTQFLEARDYPEQLKAFVNLSLGETWEEKGEQLEQGSIAARRESYGPELPASVCVVTAGVDVQDDRLEVEFVGWGIGEESWGLEYRTIRGDPSTGTPWRDLDALLLERRARVDGVALPVAAACIESGGHFSQAVYAFARERYGRRVFATKGMGSRSCCSGRHEDHDGATRRDAACARWDFCCRAMSRRNRAMKKRPRGGAPLRKARSHQRGWPLLFAPRPSRKLNTVTG